MCDGACYSLKLFGSRWAHYPERGDEWKTGEEAETTRHGPKYNDSSPVVAYIVEFLASSGGFHRQRAVGWGQKLKSGHGAHSFTAPLPTEIGHCLTRNRRNCIIFGGPKLNSRPFASGNLHNLYISFPI